MSPRGTCGRIGRRPAPGGPTDSKEQTMSASRRALTDEERDQRRAEQRELADRADVVPVDHVVGRLHVDRGVVVEPLQMPPRLGQVHALDPLAGVALGLLKGAVGAGAGRLVVHDRPLDDPAGGTLAKADDGQLAAGPLAHEGCHLGGADFDGTDECVLRAHVGLECRTFLKPPTGPGFPMRTPGSRAPAARRGKDPRRARAPRRGPAPCPG